MGICGHAQISKESSLEEPEPIHDVPDSSDSVRVVHEYMASGNDPSAIQESTQNRENSLPQQHMTDSPAENPTKNEDFKSDILESAEEFSKNRETRLPGQHRTDSAIESPMEDFKQDRLENSESLRLPGLQAVKSAPTLLEQPNRRRSPSSARKEAPNDDDTESLVLVQSPVRQRTRSEHRSRAKKRRWTPSDEDKKKFTNWTPRHSGYASQHTKRDVMPWDNIYTSSSIVGSTYSPRRRAKSVGVQSRQKKRQSGRKRTNVVH